MADKGNTIGKAYVQIMPSMKGISSHMNSLLDGEMPSVGDNAGSVLGNAMSGGLLSALSGIGGKISEIMQTAISEVASFVSDSVNVGSNFDSQMSQIAATMGMTTDDIENNAKIWGESAAGAGDTFDMLREKAKEMGAATNFSAAQAAEGLNILAMSGYDAENSVGMIEDVLHLAAAGGMEMSTAAADISGAMKGFNDASKDSAYYADLMAKGATLANTNVTQLGEALSGAAAQGSAYKQDAESMTVALLRLAEQGETGSNASTMLAAAMKSLYTPTETAAGFLFKLGVSAYDSAGNFRDINDVINDLNKALSKYDDEQRANYARNIFSIQGLEAYNKMVVTSTAKQKEWTAALADSSGEAAKQYDTMTDNLQGDIDKWNSALEGFKIEISDKVMPSVREFVQIGTDGLGKITAAFTENGIEGAAAAFGELFDELLQKAVEILPDILNAAVSLAKGVISAIANALPGILEAVSAAVPMISQALQEIGAAIVENAPVLLNALGTLFTQLLNAVLEMLPNIISGAAQIISAVSNALAEYIPEFLQVIINALPEIGTAITEALPIIIEAVGSLISALIEAFPDLLEAFMEALPDILAGLLDTLPMLIDTVTELLKEFGEMLPEILPIILPVLTECITMLIKSTAELITNNIMPLISTIIDVAVIIIDTLIENIDLFTDCVWEIIKAVGKAIYDNAPELSDKIGELVVKLIDDLPRLYDKLINAGGDLIMKIAEGFTSPQFKEAMLEWGDSVSETCEEIGESILEFWTGGKIEEIVDIGVHIIDGLWNGIKQGWQSMKDNLTKWGGTVLETIKGVFGIASPSKLMRDKVGKYLAEGIGVGFSDEITDVSKLIAKEAEDSISGSLTDVTGSISAETSFVPSPANYVKNSVYDYDEKRTAGSAVVFNQTINSPKAISQWDTYRQTKNLISTVGRYL